MYPEKFSPEFDNKDFGFWLRVIHFENRYWSINQLLSELTVKNILELSSGFSFRGLEAIKQPGLYFIDTDLPEVITAKKKLIKSFGEAIIPGGSELEILPLNVFDEKNFNKVTDRFPGGEIVIINEGLLMYLDESEKLRLCSIIHKILKQRGGYWITGDIYIRRKNKNPDLQINHDLKFFKEHHIEENKFESFEEQNNFSIIAGFIIEKEALSDRTKLSTLKYLLENSTAEQKNLIRESDKSRVTWRLAINPER